MRIDRGATNISGLFTQEGTTTVSVPSFQRNYSWTKLQVDQFLTDIYESASTNQPHFWGPIVVLRTNQDPTNLQVIDGQQRITTAVIMLALLRDKACDLSDTIINHGTPGAYDIKATVRNFLFRPPKYNHTCFTGSYLINDILQSHVLADPTPMGGGDARHVLTVKGAGLNAAQRQQTKELRAAYLHMSKSLDEFLAKHSAGTPKDLIASLFHALTTNFELHTMALMNEDDAYVLFESLNDRGLRLNPSDLLKTFTLREIRNYPGNKGKDVEAALDEWDQSVQRLGDYDFTKFLRHYLLTKTDEKVQTKRIFREFKSQIEAYGKQGATKNLQQLKRATTDYALLLAQNEHHTDAQLDKAFIRLNGFSDTHRIFLLGMLGVNLPPQSRQLLTRTAEAVSFRWIAAGWNAQGLETLYQTSVRALLKKATSTTAEALSTSMLKQAPDDTAIAAVTRSESVNLQRYILHRIEASTGANLGDPHIEHLAPQTPVTKSNGTPPAAGLGAGAYWFAAIAPSDKPDHNGMDYDDYKASWGNLTLLEHTLNQSIRNAPWPSKVQGVGRYRGISASTYNMNTHIKTMPSWTGEDILKRERWMLTCIKELVGENWVKTGNATIAMWDGT